MSALLLMVARHPVLALMVIGRGRLISSMDATTSSQGSTLADMASDV